MRNKLRLTLKGDVDNLCESKKSEFNFVQLIASMKSLAFNCNASVSGKPLGTALAAGAGAMGPGAPAAALGAVVLSNLKNSAGFGYSRDKSKHSVLQGMLYINYG